MKPLIFLAAFFLVACGKNSSGGSQALSAPTDGATPGIVADPSPFSGRQFAATASGGIYAQAWCRLTPLRIPQWTCDMTSKPSFCPTLPTQIQVHSDTSLRVFGADFESATYNNGQFILTNSGYTLDMAWRLSNDLQSYSYHVAQWGVVVTFVAGCSEVFYDVGGI